MKQPSNNQAINNEEIITTFRIKMNEIYANYVNEIQLPINQLRMK